MNEYHKIQSVFFRDPATNHKTFLEGQYSMPEFEYLANNQWVYTEKVDGTNIRVMIKDGQISYGGKTDAASIPAQLVDKLRERFDGQKEKLIEMFPEGACLYGEGYGAKIQKGGGNYGPTQDFVLFDVLVGRWWLERSVTVDVADKLGLYHVPIIGMGTLLEAIHLVKMGITSVWGNFQAEGIVARPRVELFARNGSRIITKIKTRDFQS